MSDQVGGINPFIRDFLKARKALIQSGIKKPTTNQIMNAMKTSTPPTQSGSTPGLNVEPNPSDNTEELTAEQKEEFKNNSPFNGIKSAADFENFDFSKYGDFNLLNYQGTGYYINEETGERIDVERTFGPGGYKNVKIAYTKDGITHEITFDDDGNVKSEDVKPAKDLPVIPKIEISKPPTQEDLQTMTDNLPFGKDKMPTEEELVNAGYKKNEVLMTSNGGILYENPTTGESVVVTKSITKTMDYYNKDGGRITIHYDDDGKPTMGQISKKGKAGAFTKGNLLVNPETGKMEVEVTETHKATPRKQDQAAEAAEACEQQIADFAKAIGIPEELKLSPSDILLNQNTGVGYATKVSQDKNFKLMLEMDDNGNLAYTYSQKQPDGSFKEIGAFKLNRSEDTSSLRGYDYMITKENFVTGEKETTSSTLWS